MKRAYIITCELKKPLRKYTELINRIHSYGTWAKLGNAEYILVSNHSAVQIRDYLMSAIDQHDSIFVGTLSAPAAWNGMEEEVSNWIVNHLK